MYFNLWVKFVLKMVIAGVWFIQNNSLIMNSQYYRICNYCPSIYIYMQWNVIIVPFQIPSYPSTTPPPPPISTHSLSSLPNGPVANGTDMQVQGSSIPPKRDPSPPHPHDPRENEMETRSVRKKERKKGRRARGLVGQTLLCGAVSACVSQKVVASCSVLPEKKT